MGIDFSHTILMRDCQSLFSLSLELLSLKKQLPRHFLQIRVNIDLYSLAI